MLEVAVATLAQMISADLNGNFDNMIEYSYPITNN